uniref:RNA polymerase Rpb4/RPC9 core domain-containing protein n=1 Tax=Brassica oleracea var. oleracea TaxID=109376 RepID=A0A0D3B0F0_BRAOL
MNCEVSLILEHKYEQLQQVSEDPMNQVSHGLAGYKNPDAVRQVREILSRHQLTEFELCVLGNLCPETAEEAVAMVPSLKTKGRAHSDEAIEKMLNVPNVPIRPGSKPHAANNSLGPLGHYYMELVSARGGLVPWA